MKPETNGTIQRAQKLKKVRGEGLNWVLIVGGALLSTLSIRFGCKLKQALQTRPSNNTTKVAVKRTLGACELHSNLYRFNWDVEGCYHCLSGNSGGLVDIKQAPTSPMPKETDVSLLLVEIQTMESNREKGGVMWASSPDRLELPPRPFHQSNCSDSPCVSESGSDIHAKREVIQKLRQQLKRWDDMIIEMQAQIIDLHNTLRVQMTHSCNLQSELDSVNQDLFDSEREIQRLKKIIANHCVQEVGSPEKPMAARNWCLEATNGHTNGYCKDMVDLDLNCVGVVKGRADRERVDMLKEEVGELKEVIKGKESLLQSYKEQKVKLCSKIKELQLRLDSQLTSIL